MSEIAILWLFGTSNIVLIAIIGALFRLLAAHERECRERWEHLLDEHGSLKTSVEANAQEISRMRDNQHDLRDKLPSMIHNQVQIWRHNQ